MIFYEKVKDKLNYYNENFTPEDMPTDYDLSLKKISDYYGGIIDYNDLFESINKLISYEIEVTFFEFQDEKMVSIEFYNIPIKGII